MHPEIFLLYAQSSQRERWHEAEHAARVKQARLHQRQKAQQRVSPLETAQPSRDVALERRAA
jgi:hypothetical protein